MFAVHTRLVLFVTLRVRGRRVVVHVFVVAVLVLSPRNRL